MIVFENVISDLDRETTLVEGLQANLKETRNLNYGDDKLRNLIILDSLPASRL